MELLYVIWTLAALATFLNTILLLVLSVVVAKTINPPGSSVEKPPPPRVDPGLMDIEGQHYPYHLPRP
jgi:hypothetical protein